MKLVTFRLKNLINWSIGTKFRWIRLPKALSARWLQERLWGEKEKSLLRLPLWVVCLR